MIALVLIAAIMLACIGGVVYLVYRATRDYQLHRQREREAAAEEKRKADEKAKAALERYDEELAKNPSPEPGKMIQFNPVYAATGAYYPGPTGYFGHRCPTCGR